jgi:PAS domain S-box-containing protein
MARDDTPGQPPVRPPGVQPGRAASEHLTSRLDGTRLGDFFGQLPATVWMTDEHMVLTFVQGALLRNLQVSPTQLVGRTLPDLLLDGREDHPIIQGHLTALAGHETTIRIEWGGNIHSARIAPLRGPEGQVIGCVGVQQQIGWLPDDDCTVRENDIRLQRVIDWNIIGIAFGDVQGRITDANDAFLHLVGYSREDLLVDVLSWPALLPVEHHHRQVEALNQILATGRCPPFETEIIGRDGRRIDVLVSAARLSARRREGVAFVLDVSEHKRRERYLRAELACADAIARATGADALLATVLAILCEGGLDWEGAELWRPAPEGGCQPVARCGVSEGPAHRLQTVAERAVATGEPCWTDAHTLAVPLVGSGRAHGALLLRTTRPGGSDEASVRTTQAIAERVATFLARQPG